MEVKDGSTVVTANEFDGLGRRIQRVSADDVFDDYYNEQWQLLEQRQYGDTDPLSQYVWHPIYIDALAVQYWDQDLDGDLAENNDGAHFFLYDANFNVTAVINSSSTVLERYNYTPYGDVTIMDSSFATRSYTLIGNTHLYTGRERDPETGLQLNRNRFYIPPLGRWGTRDPIRYLSGDLNLYEYGQSFSLISSDPFGTESFISAGNFESWGIYGYWSSGARLTSSPEISTCLKVL